MKVLEYLNNLCNQGASSYTALGILEEDYGITFSINEKYPELVILNYSQIDSPKFDEITKECRSLVLEIKPEDHWYDDTKYQVEFFEVVSRSFDRFFNYQEEPNMDYDITKMTAYEKVDGSLIGLFHHPKYGWLYRTRKMLMPEGSINGWDLTWKELVEETLGNFSFVKNNPYSYKYTHIFEVVSAENRVVTRYADKTAYLLACRDNNDGSYLCCDDLALIAKSNNWKTPKQYKFSTFSECTEAAKNLRDLEEGYVLYDMQGIPKVKLKNPAYVAAHHLRGEGLNPKRMLQLIFMNEQDEYLSIFPEDKDKFEPYITTHENLLKSIYNVFHDNKHIADQKEFAMSINKYPFSGVLFTARSKGLDPIDVWKESRESYKLKVMENLGANNVTTD